MIMMIRHNDDAYLLLMQHPTKLDSFGVISRLDKHAYKFMIDAIRKIRNDNKKDSWYQFPRSDDGVFTITRFRQRDTDDYVIEANFTNCLSEMIGVELDLMIFELECLPNHQVGTPSYFPPPKDKSND